jgi:hypothetical protein
VTFIARVTPPAAAGTIQFKDGDTNIGNSVIVTSGIALTITSTLTTGTHSLTAVFTPADTTKYGGSMSPPVPLTVTLTIPNRLQLFIQAILELILGRLHP